MKKHFTADVEQLIQLVTHSIYSNKEIFLRELISNANDAIQKAKFKASEDSNYLGDEVDLHIKISVDPEAKIITIEDTGIWMTEPELEKNIWTIASSGTKSFLEKIKTQNSTDAINRISTDNMDLIWQFGIGFYSAFMVADKVEVETKSNDSDKAHLRISEGKGDYEIKKSDKKSRWTIIKLFVKDEDKEFVNENKIRSLVKQHSNYVPVAIMMEEEITDKDGKWTGKKELKQINDMKSIRSKNKSEVKKEEYKKFYESLTFDYSEPLDTIHLNMEWALSYKSLLFVPAKPNQMAMFGQWDSDKEYWPDLYVQNVLIMSKCKQLFPVWMRFVKWVVETADLSLNVSREILQNSPIISKIQSSLVKEVLKSLKFHKENKRSEYEEFYKNYWHILKEWVYFDHENQEKIAETTLFYSLNEKKNIWLDEYIEKESGKVKNEKWNDKKSDCKWHCKDSHHKDSDCTKWHCEDWKSENDNCCHNKNEKLNDKKSDCKWHCKDWKCENRKCDDWHCEDWKCKNCDCENSKENLSESAKSVRPKNIYYLIGNSISELQSSPYLDQFKKHNMDVLLMDQPIDEYFVNVLPEYKWYKLVSASSPDVKLWSEDEIKAEEKKIEEAISDNKNFIAFVTSTIGTEKLEKVTFTNKLSDGIAVLSSSSPAPSANMKKMMQAMGQPIPPHKQIIEINTNHPLINKIISTYKSNPKDEKLSDYIFYIYEQALLLQWEELEDINLFLKRVNKVLIN